MHGYVQNGYYPLIKYSIHILRKMQGWLLSSQKAVGLLTTRYFGNCPLTFILTEDEDQSTEHIVVPPPWAKRMRTIASRSKTLVYYSLTWPDPFLDAYPRSSKRVTLVLYLCPNTYHYTYPNHSSRCKRSRSILESTQYTVIVCHALYSHVYRGINSL